MSTGYFSVTFYLKKKSHNPDQIGAVIIKAANAVEVRAWMASYMPHADLTDMRPCVAQFETGTKP